MLFITFITTLPGKNTEAIKLLKNPKKIEGVEVERAVGMFGRPDALIMFEAENERCASDFVIQFSNVATISTSLAFPVETLRWMQ